MSDHINSRITSSIRILAVLMTVACIFVAQSEANTDTEEITRTVIAKGEFEPPSDLIGLPQLLVASDDAGQSTTTDNTSALSTHVMNAPTGKGRPIARLKHGQQVKVLQSKNSWLKISWKSNESWGQGWLKKSFVEGNTIHAHR